MNPLQSAGFEPESYEARAELAREMLDIRGGNDRGAWVFPTIEGGRVYATDGMRLCAWAYLVRVEGRERTKTGEGRKRVNEDRRRKEESE